MKVFIALILAFVLCDNINGAAISKVPPPGWGGTLGSERPLGLERTLESLGSERTLGSLGSERTLGSLGSERTLGSEGYSIDDYMGIHM